MADDFEFPQWDLKEAAVIVVAPTDDFSFLEANPTAVHPSFTPNGTWDVGFNCCDGYDGALTNPRSSVKSHAETDVPGAHPAVLLLRSLPKNGGAYTFGRSGRNANSDVVLPYKPASRRQFCIYPNFLHRTWVIQDLSSKGITVNDCRISSNEKDQLPRWRALRYDCLNQVVFAQSATGPGITLYIKPVWPEDSRYPSWDWADPTTPGLAGLNLNTTITSPTRTRSQTLQLQQSTTPSMYCVLQRKLHADVELFYAQDLATPAMLAAERYSSESKAREQFGWRKDIQDPHLLRVENICLLDQPYILTECPRDAYPLGDFLPDEPLNSRAAYVLLHEIFSTLAELFRNRIAHGAITLDNILVEDLSPENPRFWLIGFSSFGLIPEDRIRESHSADVRMALQTIDEARVRSDRFEDPVANKIFNRFFQTTRSKLLTAQEVLDEFNTLTDGKVDFPFKSADLTKIFSLEQFQFGGQLYYRKTELAAIARALYAQNARKGQQASEAVLCTKSNEILPGHEDENLLDGKAVQSIFERLDTFNDIQFWLEAEPKRKRDAHHMQDFRIPIQITYHAPSMMWNLSQLINTIRPTSLLELGEPEDCVEVGGKAEFEGLYVDLATFQRACEALGVSPPAQTSNSDLDSRTSQFRSVSSNQGDMVLAEEKLLGAAIFRRSSGTMCYGGKEYTEANMLELCRLHQFEGLGLGILQCRLPAQRVEELCQGQPTQELSESQCQSLTESQHSIDPLAFPVPEPAQLNQGDIRPADVTEEWVDDQTSRKRRRPRASDIKPFKVVDGYLVPAHDGSDVQDLTSGPENGYSSHFDSNVPTREPSWAPILLTESDRELWQYLGRVSAPLSNCYRS